MVSPLKTRVTLDHPLQSESGATRVTGRDHRALYRSQPHRFRNGAWDEDDTQFHVYREIENPGLGGLLTFQGDSYWDRFEVKQPEGLRPYSWRPAIARGFESSDLFLTYPQDLPDPGESDYGDYSLELNARGTNYIRRYRPGNPVSSMSQFIGELHDLPRTVKILKVRAQHFRHLNSEFLNIEFGWKPFLKDLIAIYETQRTIEFRLRKLIDGNNIPRKRRSPRDTTLVTSTLAEGVLSRPFGDLDDLSIGGGVIDELTGFKVMGPTPFGNTDPFMTGKTKYSVYRILETTSWFVGTFRYYVPDIGSDQWTQTAKDALFGASRDRNHIIATLWELYPWSWLVDWFTNVGDILSNLSANAVGNEAITDAFVMQMITDRLVISADISWDQYEYVDNSRNETISIPAGSDELDYSFFRINKLRRQASPFGFGLKSGDFTPEQWLILAALGITRGKLPITWRYFNPKYW